MVILIGNGVLHKKKNEFGGEKVRLMIETNSIFRGLSLSRRIYEKVCTSIVTDIYVMIANDTCTETLIWW